MYKPTNPHKLAAIRVMQEEELAWAKSVIAKRAEQDWIDAYCTNCHWHGLRTSLIRGKSEPDCPPRCCPKCKEESIEDFNGGEDDRAMCRCGHDQSSHKQLYLDGCPTPHFPCHGYGCECGKFEQIDWDEVDANREASMLYQRDIRQ